MKNSIEFSISIKEKTIYVDDDGTFTDIFSFIASRDMNLEATILTENALAIVTERRPTNSDVITEEIKTSDADEIMEDVTFALYEFRFFKAEMFCMDFNSPIQRMFGVNSLPSIIVTLISPKLVIC